MWHNLLLALALILVIEGLLPFVNPAGFKQALQMIAQMSEKQLRTSGFISMIVGVVLMYIVNNQ